MRKLAGFLGTAAGVIIIGLIFVAVNYLLISPWAGLIALGFVFAIAVVDLIAGLAGRTYSAEIGLAWDHKRIHFWLWFFLVAMTLVGLVVHFAEVV